MKAELSGNNVKANCPDCDGAITTFESHYAGKELGKISFGSGHYFNGNAMAGLRYSLLRCANCGRGGLAKVYSSTSSPPKKYLDWFYPNAIETAKIPFGVPEDIQSEFREAESCASIGAYRAATALLRSSLEKVLKKNGYTTSNLASKINKVCEDGIITSARKNKAHSDIRVMGNNILHDEWKSVDYDEYKVAHHYTQRILEDFYDDREEVEGILKEKGLI